MSEQRTKDRLLCRLFGHRWKASHVWYANISKWVYTDHVCVRCYQTSYMLPRMGGCEK